MPIPQAAPPREPFCEMTRGGLDLVASVVQLRGLKAGTSVVARARCVRSSRSVTLPTTTVALEPLTPADCASVATAGKLLILTGYMSRYPSLRALSVHYSCCPILGGT
jgi:hypothetical protein